MKATLFPGCKAPYFVPQYESAARMVLEKFEIELVKMELNCCGYPIRFLDFKAFIFSSARVMALAGRNGLPLLCLCKCCYGTLRYADSLLRKNEALFKEVEELLKEEGLRYPSQLAIKHFLNVCFEEIDPTRIWENNVRPFQTLKVAAHYGCHILRPREVVRFDQPINPSKFETLLEVTGAISVDWPLRTQCCGDPLWGKNNELSLDLTKKKIESARQAEADLICVGCTHCQMQFDRAQKLLLSQNKLSEPLPAILYPQLLGLSLGLDPIVLGVDKALLDSIAGK